MSQSFPDDTILARWLNEELGEEELQQLQARNDYEQFQKIVKGVENLEIPSFSEEASWKQLLAKKEKLSTKNKLISIRSWWIYAAAASIALLVGIYFFGREASIKYETGIGEKLAVVLPDGSEVQMNVKSELSFKKDAWLENRIVVLKGEAFFKVKKGDRFVVQTQQAKVEVLGTSFNVCDRINWYEVTCHTGSVLVQKEQSKEILEAGDRVRSQGAGILEKTKAEVGEQPKWIQGNSKFTDIPIYLVFEEMERQFNVQIEYKAKPKIYNGGFPHQSVEAALKLVCDPMGLKYRLEGTKWVVE